MLKQIIVQTKLTLILCAVGSMFSRCSSDCKFLVSDKLSDSLFIEKYCTSRGGVYANDTYATFITDSATFRYKLGQVGDHGQLNVELKDEMVIVQYTEPLITRVIDRKDTFSIDELKLKYDYKEPQELKSPLTGESLIEDSSTWNDFYTERFESGLYSEEIQFYFTNDSTKKQKYINAVYITDSLTFRVFVCNYDMDLWTKGLDDYELGIRNKNLHIVKFHKLYDTKVIKEVKYDLKEIKASGKYKPVCN